MQRDLLLAELDFDDVVKVADVGQAGHAVLSTSEGFAGCWCHVGDHGDDVRGDLVAEAEEVVVLSYGVRAGTAAGE